MDCTSACWHAALLVEHNDVYVCLIRECYLDSLEADEGGIPESSVHHTDRDNLNTWNYFRVRSGENWQLVVLAA